ncbi:hypothetical protein EFN70_03030 [Pediococcus ethanolidurans]|uniref:hypothetical protein n=1 Tax=Pediococcus ethanolidurans TaxID=319653 RepID=UPI0021AAF4C6|nr:hypothetical protein [Pediococcus ethanolidurans]MCT4397655.1 hypothetical protein [Pediococcus ethanolidurans]
MLKNHEVFVQLGHLLDAYERKDIGAEERLDNFCRYHHLRLHERPTFETHQAVIIDYLKIKNEHPNKPDYLIAKLLDINKTTLTRIKVEFNVSRRNRKHV